MTPVNLAEKETRPPDPSLPQRRASDPAASVWVGASAGTGKTKVLTDRLLRLLLPGEDGGPGARPHRILCLTFTKAAASEMMLRLNARLGRWAVAGRDELKRDMTDLLGRPPADAEMAAARLLFAKVIDAPGGLQIMTIHAFCQSVLGRFPLETGLPPHFTVLEESEARAMLRQARNEVLAAARKNPASAEGKALSAVAAHVTEDGFIRLIHDIVRERRQMESLLDGDGGMQGLRAATAVTLGLEPGEDEASLLARALRDGSFDAASLRRAAAVMLEKGKEKTDFPAARTILDWIDAPEGRRATLFPGYRAVFFTKKNEQRSKIATKNPVEAAPEIETVLRAEAARLEALDDRQRAARCAALTLALLTLGRAAMRRYDKVKEARAALDFDDLIRHTLRLLQGGDGAAWVMFKLDGGIDHILIDEAQDTNPEQWEIIAALCDDFFSGQGTRDISNRTVFAVGDTKQSIYGFQRAAPERFAAMRAFFAQRVQAARRRWGEENMSVSFRTAPAILRLTDETFAGERLRKALGGEPVNHRSFRADAPGHAEIWPLFQTRDREGEHAWRMPVFPRTARSGGARLAEHIGETVRGWIENGEILESQGRAVEPGDILILVRRRNALVNQIIRALKTRNIAVGGADRIVLSEQLAVRDLLAAAQFALLPADDLTLACLLKSPLIGWDDARLERHALDRKKSLWETIQAEKSLEETSRWLSALSAQAGAAHPYEFFSMILQLPCPGDPVSGWHGMTARLGPECLDPLEELLNAALAFERTRTPTLQGFLIDIQRDKTDIRREQAEAGGAVRIMTVHGAKGLEAPIVILPDTVRTSRTPPGNSDDRLLWPDKSTLPVPLWSPSESSDFRLYRTAYDMIQGKQDEEYYRLLYVAMTRARDRLYVCGHTGRRQPLPDSWYHTVNEAAQRMAEMRPERFHSLFHEEEEGMPAFRLRISDHVGTAGGKGIAPRNPGPEEAAAPPPSWLTHPAPSEPDPPRPLSPSRPEGPAPAAQSPLGGGDSHRFRRGVVTHRLLQYLPVLDPGQRRGAATDFVGRYGADLPDDIRRGIADEVMTILEHPDFAPLFGPDSLAEVPVSGRSGMWRVSGQIDRLLVRGDAVWIVDYKTNRPPPRDPSTIPDQYRRQMNLYRDIVSDIYQNRTVRCFLLWTDGPFMTEL